jgi:hypothetical protein
MPSFTTITANTDPQSRTIINELTLAYNECALAAYGPGFAREFPTTGDSIHSGPWWRDFQDNLEVLALSFVDPDGGDNGDFTNETEILLLTLERWRELAGLNEDGFTAYIIHPDNTGTPIYRSLEVGDIAGWWVASELQKGLKVLKMTTASYPGGWDHENAALGYTGNGYSSTSANNAWDNAVADYAQVSFNPVNEPCAWTQWGLSDPLIPLWAGYLIRISMCGKWILSGRDTLTRDTDFYAVGSIFTGCTFDGNGDFSIGYIQDTLYLYDTQVAQSGESGLSNSFGPTATSIMPNKTNFGDTKGYYTTTTVTCIFTWYFTYT